MNRLSRERRAAIIRALVDGSSIRAAARIAGVNKDTVTKLLEEVGDFCEVYQSAALINLKAVRTVELDEIWSFVGAKEQNKTHPSQGDLWTYTAICADSKLVFSWLVGSRVKENTKAFVADVASRLPYRVQISSDANLGYLTAVEEVFGYNGCDFGQIIKRYSKVDEGLKASRRYSPGKEVVSVEKSVIFGKPNAARISTSYVERQNLTMRMQMRRFTRLTNAFSRKAANHAYAVALHYMIYNYVRPHGTLTKEFGGIKTTPAMAAEITDHVWTVEEILAMIDGDVLLGKAA